VLSLRELRDVIAGAAAESILIALAVAKSGDEKTVLKTHNGSQGRKRTADKILQGVSESEAPPRRNAVD
jgi:hypothetical protein